MPTEPTKNSSTKRSQAWKDHITDQGASARANKRVRGRTGFLFVFLLSVVGFWSVMPVVSIVIPISVPIATVSTATSIATSSFFAKMCMFLRCISGI